MPRNLGMTSCYFCDAELELEERPRLIAPEEANIYYDEYKQMLVAKAHCPDCWALYLAWMGDIPHGGTGLACSKDGIFDLSFLHSFSADPGDEDLPKFHIVEHLELERVPFGGRAATPPPNTLYRRWRMGSA